MILSILIVVYLMRGRLGVLCSTTAMDSLTSFGPMDINSAGASNETEILSSSILMTFFRFLDFLEAK